VNERKEVDVLYKIVLEARMSEDEKKDQLPGDLKKYDKGGMFFPKPGLLKYAEKAMLLASELNNEDYFKKYGKNLIQVRLISFFIVCNDSIF
jgi:hypothetical protein